jgi:nitrite reductase (NADH) small subunit
MSDTWVRITNCENIPLREGRVVDVKGVEIAIFNLGDRFLAVRNRCPHQGGPLADGIVSGSTVVCPLHAWKVELESGAVVRPGDSAHCVRTFQTRVDQGVVLFNLADLNFPDECGPAQQESALHQSTAPGPSLPARDPGSVVPNTGKER